LLQEPEADFSHMQQALLAEAMSILLAFAAMVV
jgi:hypothetical protein